MSQYLKGSKQLKDSKQLPSIAHSNSPQSLARSVSPVKSAGQSISPMKTVADSELGKSPLVASDTSIDIGPRGEYEKLEVPGPKSVQPTTTPLLLAKSDRARDVAKNHPKQSKSQMPPAANLKQPDVIKQVVNAPSAPSDSSEIDIGPPGQYDKLLLPGQKPALSTTTPDGYEKLIPLLLPKYDRLRADAKKQPKQSKSQKPPAGKLKKSAVKKGITKRNSTAEVLPSSQKSSSRRATKPASDASTSQGYELMDWQIHGVKQPRFVIVKDWIKEKKEPNSFWDRHPRYVWIIVALLTLALIASLICLVIVSVIKSPALELSPNSSQLIKEPYVGQVHTFFQGICHEKFPGIANSCLAGPSPSIDSCSTGICIRFSYQIERRGPFCEFLDRTHQQSETESPTQWLSSTGTGSRLLCRISIDRLGVCSDTGQCDQPYHGHDSNLDEDGQWIDNCDKPNPCWDGQIDVFGSAIKKDGVATSRDECQQQIQTCDQKRDAVIWLQHLRCKIPNHKTAKKICQGLPLRLWVCKHCQSTIGPPACSGTLDDAGCIYFCTDSTQKTFVIKKDNGVNCTIKGQEGQEAYCYEGHCFKSEGVYNSKEIPSMQECELKKTQDEAA